MPYTVKLQQRSLATETWLEPIGDPIVAEFGNAKDAMRDLYDKIQVERAGDWTYFMLGPDGARYSLNAAYLKFAGKRPCRTRTGFSYPAIGRRDP